MVRRRLNQGAVFTGETQEVGNRVWALTNQGRVLVREIWASRTDVTPAGRKFYEDFVAEVVPRVPILRVVERGMGEVEGRLVNK